MDAKDCDPVTLDLFRQKFFGSSQPKVKQDQKKAKKEKQHKIEDKIFKKETDIHTHATGDKNLDYGDILNLIEKDDGSNKDTINTTKIKKQLKKLSKDSSKKLDAPISGIKRVKIMREKGQEMASKHASKYIPQVKQAREEVQHDFTTPDKIRSGGATNLKSISQIASNINSSNPASTMEQKIQDQLTKAGLQSEKDLI